MQLTELLKTYCWTAVPIQREWINFIHI